MYNRIQKDSTLIGIEIGIWEAANAVRLLEQFPNLTLIGIDPFEGYQDWCSFFNTEYMSEREKVANTALQKYIDQNRFKLIRKFSDQALADLENQLFDFIYVDADHSYEWALHDITNYWKLVKSGGILCGHDRSLEGVSRALNEFMSENNLTYVATEQPQTDSWYIIKE